MHSLKDLKHQEQRDLHGNECLGFAGLAIHGTNVENVLTANAVSFKIGGVMYSKAAATEIDLSALAVIDEDGAVATLAALADLETQANLLVVNSAGTVKIVQGEAVATGSSVYCPACPDGYAPLGVIKIANATGSDFTLGTTNLNTAGITDTYYNLGMVPATALA